MTSDPAARGDPKSRALLEIAAIDDELQRTFERVIDVAEAILAEAESGGESLSDALNAAIGELFEAAAMRDIAGQRLTAVRKAVEELSDSSADSPQTKRDKASKIDEKRGDESTSESGLLNGPQLPGAAKSQAEVDALFDNLD